jgi:hypothetical protein
MTVEIFPRPKPTTQLKAAEQEVQAVVIPNSNGVGTCVRHRAKNGMFQKKPKPPSAAAVRQAVASKLTTPDETGVSPYEKSIDAMIVLSQSTNEKESSSAVKAFEALGKASGFADKPEERQQFVSIVITMPDLPNMGEIQPREKLIPSFIDAEVLHTNVPQLSASEMQPQEKPKAPKEKPEPVLCECATQSPRYCPKHRPY